MRLGPADAGDLRGAIARSLEGSLRGLGLESVAASPEGDGVGVEAVLETASTAPSAARRASS